MLYVISSCVLLFVCGVQYLTIEKTSLVVPVLLCVSVAIESDVDWTFKVLYLCSVHDRVNT